MRPILLSLCVLLPVLAQESKHEEHSKFDENNKRIRESAQVLDEVMGAGDKGIPRDLLHKAQCVGIVPNLKRAGFVIGGEYGKGVLTCRVPEQTGWSAVSTIRVEGGSVGLQIGAGETDLVFIVMNESGMDRLMKDKFTIGADAAVMAGPVGRTADAHTDALMKAEILAYSRSRGVFGGVSLQGATLRPDKDDNAKVYGHPVGQDRILHGQVKPTPEMTGLYDELNRWAPFKKS